jgi:hypothetical protein
MAFLRDLFRAFFCKSKKQEELDKNNINQPCMQVVHKKEQQEIQNEVNISSSNKPIIFNTKREKLIHYLSETTEGITKSKAYEKFKINRLDTMIYALKKEGYVFETKKIIGNKGLYFLISKPKNKI